MSWQAILNTLPLLTLNDTEIFAPPREMETAIASYNRALINLRSDSSDVAQIALRKLVINYPLFGPASLLFAIGLIEQRRYAAAKEVIDRARLAGLSALEGKLADELALQIPEEVLSPAPASAPPGKYQNAGKSTARSEQTNAQLDTSPILMKTGRPAKARMASRREVKNVLRRGDSAPQETRILTASRRRMFENIAVDWLLIGKIAGAAVLITVLIFGAIFLIRQWPVSTQSSLRPPNDQERLSFLLGRLDELAIKDAQIAVLLEEYQQFVQPDFATTEHPSESLASETPPAETTLADDPAEPAETTEAVNPNDLLTQIYHEYEAAMIVASSDVVSAAESLLNLQTAADSLKNDLTSPAVPLSVDELKAKINDSLDMYRTDAAEALRILGRDAYDLKNHQLSLDYYLRAYALKPLAYGGGVAYYCGRNYQALGDNEKARPFYQFVIDHYPGSEVADYATVRLLEIG